MRKKISWTQLSTRTLVSITVTAMTIWLKTITKKDRDKIKLGRILMITNSVDGTIQTKSKTMDKRRFRCVNLRKKPDFNHHAFHPTKWGKIQDKSPTIGANKTATNHNHNNSTACPNNFWSQLKPPYNRTANNNNSKLWCNNTTRTRTPYGSCPKERPNPIAS